MLYFRSNALWKGWQVISGLLMVLHWHTTTGHRSQCHRLLWSCDYDTTWLRHCKTLNVSTLWFFSLSVDSCFSIHPSNKESFPQLILSSLPIQNLETNKNLQSVCLLFSFLFKFNIWRPCSCLLYANLWRIIDFLEERAQAVLEISSGRRAHRKRAMWVAVLRLIDWRRKHTQCIV